jgi:hypothetical protein
MPRARFLNHILEYPHRGVRFRRRSCKSYHAEGSVLVEVAPGASGRRSHKCNHAEGSFSGEVTPGASGGRSKKNSHAKGTLLKEYLTKGITRRGHFRVKKYQELLVEEIPRASARKRLQKHPREGHAL